MFRLKSSIVYTLLTSPIFLLIHLPLYKVQTHDPRVSTKNLVIYLNHHQFRAKFFRVMVPGFIGRVGRAAKDKDVPGPERSDAKRKYPDEDANEDQLE